MTDETTGPAAESAHGNEPEPEPTDAQLRSDEARRLRHRAREAEEHAARLIVEAADREAAIQARERAVVEQHLSAKLRDPNDFWREADLPAVRGDQGVVDFARVDQRADEVLAEHPHWAAPDPRVPTAAPAAAVDADGRVGWGPRNMLDAESVAPIPVRGWGQFLNDAKSQAQPEG